MATSASTDTTPAAAVPVYERRDIPEHLAHLRTMTGLKALRLKPAQGQEPVAMVRVYRRGHGWGDFPLYDPADAAPMRPLSARQEAAMLARRACPRCKEVRDHPVQGLQCSACNAEDHAKRLELLDRTCWKCRRVSAAALPREHSSRCVPCWVWWRLQQQWDQERAGVWRRTCPGPGCDKVTATDEEIEVARADRAAYPGGWVPVWCPTCKERDDLEQAERQRQYEEEQKAAEEHRRQRVADLEQWARDLLADPDTVVLDTETTGLEDDARIVELAAYNVAGQTLLDTLIDPGGPIPPDATDVHGITDQWVAGAPSFAAALPKLTEVLAGRRCLIYNAPYDKGRLRHELTLHYQQTGHDNPEEAAAAWLEAVRIEDVMLPYSEWYGEWSDYWGGWAWQPLYGGDHRALGDCRAVVDRLHDMAEGER